MFDIAALQLNFNLAELLVPFPFCCCVHVDDTIAGMLLLTPLRSSVVDVLFPSQLSIILILTLWLLTVSK
jgi:hypothetical protein